MRVGLVDIYLVKEVLVHKIPIALVVVRADRIILVKVHRGNLGEINLTGLVHLGKLRIHPLGGGSGSKTEHGIGLLLHNISNDFSGLCGNLCIVLANDNLHGKFSFSSGKLRFRQNNALSAHYNTIVILLPAKGKIKKKLLFGRIFRTSFD